MIRASKTTAVRHERSRPGELVHMDVKKLGCTHAGVGWKARGQGGRQNWRQKQARIGYGYIQSVIDGHSRLAYAAILADEKGTTCVAFLARAIEFFAQAGIPRIERLMTDNAWAYRWSPQRSALLMASTPAPSPASGPWQNGKAERSSRSSSSPTAYPSPRG